MDPFSELPLRRIFRFWLPLAFTWLMMATEGPFLAAVIARLPEPEPNLAAYGVAFALALIVEAPIIMIMSAATALVRSRDSYLRMRNFTSALNAVITAAMVVLLVPAVFDLVAERLIGLPDEVARRTHIATLLLLPWPATIGFRRFYQGVLIRRGLTRLVAYGTVVRLTTMAATALLLYRRSWLDGAAVGAAALSAGVTLEALTSRVMAHRTIRGLLSGPLVAEPEPLTYRSIAAFYYPLALTSLLGLGLHPVVTFFVGHSRQPVDSLAVLPVVFSLVLVFRAFGLAFQEVAIALIGDRFEGYPALRTFALALGVAVATALTVIAWTPLATVWFQHVSGLSPHLTRLATVSTRILSVIPGLTVLLSLQRAMAVSRKTTSPVTWATAIEVAGAVGVLTVGVMVLHGIGAVVAAVALLTGRVGANLYLMPVLARVLAQSGRHGARGGARHP